MHYNIYLGFARKTSIFIKKIILNAGTGMGWGYPNPSGMGMRFTFSSTLGMGRVTGKYMRIGYGDGECKTRPRPTSLPCLFPALFHRIYPQSLQFLFLPLTIVENIWLAKKWR